MITFILVWILCGIGAAGLTFAYFQGEYPQIACSGRKGDYAKAFYFGIWGPLGLIMSFFLSGYGKHGWRLW